MGQKNAPFYFVITMSNVFISEQLLTHTHTVSHRKVLFCFDYNNVSQTIFTLSVPLVTQMNTL